MTLTKQIQNLTASDTVAIQKVLPITTKADQERAETLALLKKCVPQVGMYLGEELNERIAQMEGAHFSAKDYHSERMPGEQGI